MEAHLGTDFYNSTDSFNMIQVTANHGSEFIENEPAAWARIAS